MRAAIFEHGTIVTVVGWPKRFFNVNNKWISLTLWVDENKGLLENQIDQFYIQIDLTTEVDMFCCDKNQIYLNC